LGRKQFAGTALNGDEKRKPNEKRKNSGGTKRGRNLSKAIKTYPPSSGQAKENEADRKEEQKTGKEGGKLLPLKPWVR